MKITALLASGILPVAFAAPSSKYVLHEQREALQSNWAKGDAANEATVVPASIALKQSNVEKGEKLIMELSDPESPKYGQHLSNTEIMDLFAPSEETINNVKKWLIDSGVAAGSIEVSPSKGWVHFNTTAGQLGSLLKTQYHQYTDKTTSRTYFGTESYSLPQDVAAQVDFVMPATSFSQLKKSRARPKRPLSGTSSIPDPNSLANCDKAITPKCIRAMYGIPNATSKQSGNELALFETEDDEWNQDDLNKFYKDMQLDIPQGYGAGLVSVNNGTAPGPQRNAGPESSLDVDIVIPLIYPQGTTVYQVGYHTPQGHNFNEVFTYFMDSLVGPYCHDDGNEGNGKDCNTYKVPNVLSISWGDVENPSLVSFHKRQCTEWMKLGLAGTTVIFASGDYGAQPADQCYGPNKDMFIPDGPSSCPYITSVGSTYLRQGSKVGDPESATDSFASGGGFSNIFTVPDWQASAVSTFLNDHTPSFKSYNTTDGKLPSGRNAGKFNRNGRGFPDIAAAGDNGYVVTGGQGGLGGGTSMSAPLFASMVNLINEDRIKAGKSSVGFINPSLYKMAAKGNVFNDITIGGMAATDNCGTNGFDATPGWDPVTGLGTPNYEPLHDFFMSLQ